ncbi:MAG TPA: hypothetical protein ENN39_12890 [Desulfonatronum sp.]|nr:hypothetical protein [Desulfonatronum sp.]
MTNRLTNIAATAFWHSPLLLAFLLTFTTVGVTSLDSGLYLKKAFQFTQGQIDWGFRPGFIALLAAAFETLGVSVWSATVVIRIFFFANVVLIFYMTRYLANIQAAFAASLTLTTSYYLAFLSHRVLLDNVHPFFVLLAVFLSILAIDRQSNRLAILAGIAFIYAYLIKATTLLFVPFPILLVILYEGIRLNRHKLHQAGIIFAITCMGIAAYQLLLELINIRAHEYHPLGRVFEGSLVLLFADNPFLTLKNILNGFIGYWTHFLFKDPWLGWLFTVAWTWMIILSIKRRRLRALLALFLLFLPAMLYLGHTKPRLGQSGVFLFTSFASIGVFFAEFCRVLTTTFSRIRVMQHSLPLTAGVATIILAGSTSIYQVWSNGDMKSGSKQWLQDTTLGRYVRGESQKWTMKGTFSQDIAETAEIVANHAETGSIVFTGFTNRWAMDFFTGYNNSVKRFPVRSMIRARSLLDGFATELPGGATHGNLLFLWPNAWDHRLQRWDTAGQIRIRYIDEQTIVQRFEPPPYFIWEHYAFLLRHNVLLTDSTTCRFLLNKPEPERSHIIEQMCKKCVILKCPFWSVTCQADLWADSKKSPWGFISSRQTEVQNQDCATHPHVHNPQVFIALDKRYSHISTYLEQMPNVRALSKKLGIYQVDAFNLVEDFKPHVAYEMGMLLDELRQRHPKNYSVLRDEFFPRFFRFTPEQVDALADRDEEKAGVVFMGYPGRRY